MVSTAVKVISDGVIKFDGGSMFGQVPKVAWENSVSTDRRNRMTLGLNCLLLQVNGQNILVDTGVGSKDADNDKEHLGLGPSRLLKGLKGLGLGPKDIHAVILTHLHFDHSGGCTKLDRAGNLVPTFPKARYYVQEACWNEACHPNERCHVTNRADNFMPIEERGQLELLDGDCEIFPGLNVIVTDGHAQGHQMVMFNHGGERVVFLGDIVPTPHHLNLAVISAFDNSPEVTLERKRDLLGQAERQGWLLVFSHGHDVKAGYLERKGDTGYLRPVDL
ncbi:MAG: MBL fold metallo-hydrolase [Chloroflexi bacterium]|nr:MBL fold metallo-hydrolase [Chloroflexota bacterium]